MFRALLANIIRLLFVSSLLFVVPPARALALHYAPSAVIQNTPLTQVVSGPSVLPSLASSDSDSSGDDDGDSDVSAVTDSGLIVGRSETGEWGNYHAVLWENGATVDLGTLGAPPDDTFAHSTAYDVSSTGQIVGSAVNANGDTHAALWEDGRAVDLGVVGGFFSEAYAINDAGLIVGVSDNDLGQRHAAMWKQGEPIALPTLGGEESIAWGVLDDGTILGDSVDSGGTRFAVTWKDGEIQKLDAFGGGTEGFAANQRGDIVGITFKFDGSVVREIPVLWQNGKALELETLGGEENRPLSMNDAGQTVGWARYAEGTSYAYRPVIWEGSKITPLLGLVDDPLKMGEARSINSSGQAVGYIEDDDDQWTAVLWQDGAVISLGRPTGASYSAANVITDTGLIVGEARIEDADGFEYKRVITWQVSPSVAETTLEPTPMPGTLTLDPVNVPTTSQVEARNCDLVGSLYETLVRTGEELAISPAANLLATGNFSSPSISLWNLGSGRPVPELLPEQFDAVRAIGFSPDGKWLAAADWTSGFGLWNVQTRELVAKRLVEGQETVLDVSFSPVHNVLATLSLARSGQSTLRYWMLPSLKPMLEPIVTKGDSARALAFSPDGTLTATAGASTSIQLWNGVTGVEQEEIQASSGSVFDLTFSPDGSLLAAAETNGTVEIWDTESWEPKMVHWDSVGAIAFSTDDTLLAIGGSDGSGGSLRIWNLEEGKWHTGSLSLRSVMFVSGLEFLSNAEIVVTGLVHRDTSSNCSTLWRVNVDDLPPAS